MNRSQKGRLFKLERRSRPDVWVFRWYENTSGECHVLLQIGPEFENCFKQRSSSFKDKYDYLFVQRRADDRRGSTDGPTLPASDPNLRTETSTGWTMIDGTLRQLAGRRGTYEG
jgi:hypothetical protein